ncbi:transmembrane protein 18 [Aplysia californica]|uniref:Transmembrane protein 18 n=1 Tax=Aplysia californica TaxID=6500 RepID=A0ABM0JLS8_APLCA|nr:transmembrane protein 18 [Aplysia californica]
MEPIKTTQITSIWTYLETVDWSDPWFSGLLAFHLFTFLVTFLTRNKQMLQAAHFLVLLLLVYFAETLNELAAKHYKVFSRQQYFDSKGMFISLVWSAPLLMNCLIIVMMWILFSSQLMVTTGRLRLEQERKALERREKEKAAGGGGGGNMKKDQ